MEMLDLKQVVLARKSTSRILTATTLCGIPSSRLLLLIGSTVSRLVLLIAVFLSPMLMVFFATL